MSRHNLRRRVAWEAARLIYTHEESEYYRAKLKAARRLVSAEFQPSDLPSNREVRDEIQAMALRTSDPQRDTALRALRQQALRMMRVLHRFRPRLVGRVWAGQDDPGSTIELCIFADTLDAVTAALDAAGLTYDIQRLEVRKRRQEHVLTRVSIEGPPRFELSIYPLALAHRPLRSGISGQLIEGASISELEQILDRHRSDLPAPAVPPEAAPEHDRFQVYEALLLPLEQVRESPRQHPEGDVLYHSLQVFDLARDELPYDEEFLLAALLHDVGKAIDPEEHVAAALAALDGSITARTAWLIQHHVDGLAVLEGTIGARARRRLEQSEDFEELKLLAQCDRRGRRRGVAAPSLDEALNYLRDLAQRCGD